VGTFAFNNVNNNFPRLFSLDINSIQCQQPVTSIDFSYASGGGHGAIMAVSGGNGGTFNPLDVVGYNEDIVVEAGAGLPGALTGYTTATMDTGITNALNTCTNRATIRTLP